MRTPRRAEAETTFPNFGLIPNVDERELFFGTLSVLFKARCQILDARGYARLRDDDDLYSLFVTVDLH